MEEFFKDPRTIKRARSSASGPYLTGYIQWLREIGYAPVSVEKFVSTAIHLGLWTHQTCTPIPELNEGSIDRFQAHLETCVCPCPKPSRRQSRTIALRAMRFLRFLREKGIAPETTPPRTTEAHPLVSGFESWMSQHRGVTPTTLRIYERIVTEALHVLGDDPSAFSAHNLRNFVLDRCRDRGRSKAKLIVTSMRAFLRYLIASGGCSASLEGAIPTIAGWRLTSLPRYLCSADVERVLATCDPSTSMGTRNRSILLLLARLGLRAGDVASLCLDDFDWRDGTFVVAGKSRTASRLPLPQEVGDAILAYLPHRVPKELTSVFLRLRPPWGPLACCAITSIATRAIRASGVVSPALGAHVLRH